MGDRRRGWEELRVFISSTFRDMQAERDHLVKVVFPELRERLEKHRIYFVDIDLRWGVTQEQSDNDEALELCLEEIDRCRPEEGDRRPFFIGILGERYGWVPETVRPEVLERCSWIPDYPEHSVTALEIIHGVLLNPPMHGQSFFYFRDPAFMEHVPDSIREAVLEPEDDEAQDKLAALKQRIRESGIPFMEDYPCKYAGMRINWRLVAQELDEAHRDALMAVAVDGVVAPAEWDSLSPELRAVAAEHGTVDLDGLETFGEQVREDLLWAIAQQYPEILEEPAEKVKEEDALAVEQDLHERFAESRLRIYVGRDQVHRELAEYLDGEAQEPLVLAGPSGCGKSAILARLYTEYAREQTFVLPHFIGASAASTSVASMLRRLCRELQDHFGFPGEMPDDPAELPGTFRMFLGMLPEDRRAAIIIDALDQLDERDREMGLPWLPTEFPLNTKLVLSCLDDVGNREVLEELQERGHPMLQVPPLTEADCEEIIQALPSMSAKTLDEHQRGLLLANPATRNALYLQVVLEELRGFGSFDQLNIRIAQFGEAEDVTELFGQVLERLELDFGESLVAEVTCLLAASRAGLTEGELADLLSETDTRGEMQVVLRQLRTYLLRRDELIDYYHLALDRAVVARYQAGEDDPSWHVRLADYFERAELGLRKVEELPWQLAQAEAWRRLHDILADVRFLSTLWDADQFEAKAYWAEVEAKSELRLVNAYASILGNPPHPLEGPRIWCVGQLLADTGHADKALALYEDLLEHSTGLLRGLFEPQALGAVALSLRQLGRVDEAQRLLQKQEGVCRQLGNRSGLAESLTHQALILHERGNLAEALDLHTRAAQLFRELNDRQGLAVSLGNQALILADRNDLEGAMSLHNQEEQIYRELGDRGGLQRTLGNQARIRHAWKELDAALRLCEQQERICSALGDKSGLHKALVGQAEIAYDRKDRSCAVELLQRAEQLCREVGNTRDLQLVLSNQAEKLHASGDLDGALAAYAKQETLYREQGDLEALKQYLSAQALKRMLRDDMAGGIALYREQERICRELDDLEELASRFHDHAAILYDGAIMLDDGHIYESNRPQSALALLREEERLCRELGDVERLATCLVDRALTLHEMEGASEDNVALVEEAHALAREHGLNELAEQIKPVVGSLRSELG